MLIVRVYPGQFKRTIKSGSDISMFYPKKELNNLNILERVIVG